MIALLTGLFHRNPYAGLVVFVAIPGLFVFGLLLMPLGMWLQRRRLRRDPRARPTGRSSTSGGPTSAAGRCSFTALTAVNVVILLLAGYSSLHWMESPPFCGQVCHTPMTAAVHRLAGRDAPAGGVRRLPHRRRASAGFVYAKAAGTRQLLHVATGAFPRPIPPGAEMPPGAQAADVPAAATVPGAIVGDRLRVIREYADDEASTETTTVLQMHVGTAVVVRPRDPLARRSERRASSTWPPTHERQTIPYVKVTDARGVVKEYRTADATDQLIRDGQRRTMDCIDCHNTVGHPIAPTAEQAVDRYIARTWVSRQLPFVRREAVRLMKASYPSSEAGAEAIDRDLRTLYAAQERPADQQALAHTVSALQGLYRRSVFPTMKVTWGSYPDNRGHMTSNGCFRCHDDSHKASDGSTISGDCEYCHKQIENPL